MGRAIKTMLLITILMLLLSGCQTSVPPTQTPPAVTPPTSQPESVQPAANTSQPAPTTTNASQPAAPPPPVAEPPAPAPPIGVSIGNLAPDFQLTTFTGDNISLWGLRGKPVLLNFWATWCGPCKFEMPFLQQIHESYSDKGLVLLAVDFGEKPDKIQKFMDTNNVTLTMPMPMDTDGKVTTKTYLVGALPTTFLIDKEGIIRQKVIGAFANKEAIENELKKIMP